MMKCLLWSFIVWNWTQPQSKVIKASEITQGFPLPSHLGRVMVAPLFLGIPKSSTALTCRTHSRHVLICTGLGASSCPSPGAAFLRAGGPSWDRMNPFPICLGVGTLRSQTSPWPLAIQANIHGPPAQVSPGPSSPCGQLLSWLLCWVTDQLPGQLRPPLGMFQFSTSMLLRLNPPPSQPFSLPGEVITLQLLHVALVMTSTYRWWPCSP